MQPSPGNASNPVMAALLTPEGRALVESLMPYDPATAMAMLSRARSDPRWADQPEVVAAAATQARLRTRATARFPGPARWWTPDGLEQATRPEVAARHARRFVQAGVQVVADLGCGAGSDALAMAAAGLQVLAVDRDPEALWALSATAADLGLDVTTSSWRRAHDAGTVERTRPRCGSGLLRGPGSAKRRESHAGPGVVVAALVVGDVRWPVASLRPERRSLPASTMARFPQARRPSGSAWAGTSSRPASGGDRCARAQRLAGQRS